jgi:hypothetical protein
MQALHTAGPSTEEALRGKFTEEWLKIVKKDVSRLADVFRRRRADDIFKGPTTAIRRVWDEEKHKVPSAVHHVVPNASVMRCIGQLGSVKDRDLSAAAAGVQSYVNALPAAVREKVQLEDDKYTLLDNLFQVRGARHQHDLSCCQIVSCSAGRTHTLCTSHNSLGAHPGTHYNGTGSICVQYDPSGGILLRLGWCQ